VFDRAGGRTFRAWRGHSAPGGVLRGKKELSVSQVLEIALCPPHHWEVTSVRIEGVCHYHHHCVKCNAEKDVPLSATGSNKWVSRSSKNKA
jgi:hypothetical protein